MRLLRRVFALSPARSAPLAGPLASAVVAEAGIASWCQTQAWVQLKADEPTPLKLGALIRLGARTTAASVAVDDHPNEKRFADRFDS